LLSAGYAEAFRRFRFERKVEFVALEKEAKQKKRGLWSSKNVPFFEHKKRK
jgi:endonuclease YncB( thermonuclease family)